MRVGRDPGFIPDQRFKIRADVQVVLKKARVLVGAAQKLAPGVLMTFEAGQLEARKAFDRRRVFRPVDRGDALESNVMHLPAHMREAVRVPVEIDDEDLHRKTRAGPSDLHLRAELDNPIGRQIEKVGSACSLFGHRDEKLVLPQGHAGIGRRLRVRRPKKNEVVMMSNLSPAFRIAASARGMCGCSM